MLLSQVVCWEILCRLDHPGSRESALVVVVVEAVEEVAAVAVVVTSVVLCSSPAIVLS